MCSFVTELKWCVCIGVCIEGGKEVGFKCGGLGSEVTGLTLSWIVEFSWEYWTVL